MVAAVTVRKNGKAEMAYVGEKPWHGLGQELTAGASIAKWIKEAGMDWEVLRAPVQFDCGQKSPCTWDDQNVLFRSDTRKPLSVVSDSYKIVQPKEVMEFFRTLTEANKMTMETAGTLFGGRRYWALARTGHSLNVAGKDVLGGYLLLATSCDGSYATTAKFTSIRVVCNNTLTAAMNGSKNAVSVRHSSKFSDTQVKLDLGLLDEAWEDFGVNANLLAKRKITKKEAVMVLVKAFGDAEKFETDAKKGDLDQAFAAQPNTTGMAKILELFDGAAMGADLASSKGTAWGLVNATTQYFDHTAGRIQDARLSKAWFGKNENKKLAVFDEALELVGSK